MEKTQITLLLVDDDEEEYLLLRDMLRRGANSSSLLRMRLDWAGGYQEALSAIASGFYDAALVDYHLGEYTGIDLLRVLNQRDKRIPVILMTGQGSYDIDVAAMQEGAADYLLKGEFDAALLERAVRYAMERQRNREELMLRVREREMLLERLSVEQSRLQAVIANAASGIVVADSSGHVVLANPIAEQLLGDALIYGEPLRLNRPGGLQHPAGDRLLDGAAQRGEAWENIEIEIPGKEGEMHYLLAAATPIRDSRGRSSGAVGVFQDITARKQLEVSLQRQAARAQLLAVLSRAFAEAGLDDQTVLDTVTRQIASGLADACIIRLVSDNGDWLSQASLYSRNPGFHQELQRAAQGRPTRSDSGFSGYVLSAGTPIMLSGFDPQRLERLAPNEIIVRAPQAPVHSLLLVPLRSKDQTFGVLLLLRMDNPEPFSLEDLHFIEDLAGRAALAIENARLYEAVQHLSVTDSLTGLYNRRGLLSLSESELARAMRLHQHVAVVMIDIDHFKLVNDTYGHATGDEVLRAVAGRLRAALRNQDVLARYGGEEFAILLPECCPVMGASIAERLRALFDQHPVQTRKASISITISVGMTVREPTSIDLNDLMQLADQAMYQAKEAGRNQVKVISSGTPVPGEEPPAA